MNRHYHILESDGIHLSGYLIYDNDWFVEELKLAIWVDADWFEVGPVNNEKLKDEFIKDFKAWKNRFYFGAGGRLDQCQTISSSPNRLMK